MGLRTRTWYGIFIYLDRATPRPGQKHIPPPPNLHIYQHEQPDGRLIVHRPAGHQYGLGDGSFEVFEWVKGEQQQQQRVVQELRPGFY